MKFCTALSLVSAIALAQQHEFIDGHEVIGEQEIVTTWTEREHIDIVAGHEDCTNCIYNDFVLVLDRMTIHEWSLTLKAEYDLLMRDWHRSLEHFSFELKALNEDYWVMFRPLVEARKAIFRRRHDQVISYVARNTYFHGAHITDVVPEIERFLKNEFNPHSHNQHTHTRTITITETHDEHGNLIGQNTSHRNLVSMFNLGALSLLEAGLDEELYAANSAAEWANMHDQTFTFDFDEDEVIAWFVENEAKYEEVEAKYQQDFDTFTAEVDAAVAAYQEGEDRVHSIYESIVRNAAADAELYWEMHFDSPLEEAFHVDINQDGDMQDDGYDLLQ
jgi:hypothetical protein